MKREELELKTNLLLAERELLDFNNKRHIDWAIELMQDGYDVEELHILAGLDEIQHYEIKKYFEAAAGRLELSVECSIDHLKSFLYKVMKEAIAGERTIHYVSKIVFSMNCVLDYTDSDLFHLANLVDYWEIMELPNGAPEDGYEEYVKNEFKIYLENNKQ